jgi:murein DD-endopeptidase MepM/ murein hydrolase activator NlpD
MLTPSPSPAPTTQPQTEICSPLAGYELAQLAGQISNPYNPPPPGSDDPHYGVDLADFSPSERIARSGMPVQAVLSGQVAGMIANRFPYGNALMVETPLHDLDEPTLARLSLPDPPVDVIQPLALTCPPYPLPEDWQTRPRSLYVLYAHLRDAPDLKTGDAITCGQAIGAVGDSGNALVPHLHLEARVGPAEMTFSSMAHYDPSATSEEMAVYCLWRVSGLFQSIDAMCLLDECSSRP